MLWSEGCSQWRQLGAKVRRRAHAGAMGTVAGVVLIRVSIEV